jgi:hypothetical protein
VRELLPAGQLLSGSGVACRTHTSLDESMAGMSSLGITALIKAQRLKELHS